MSSVAQPGIDAEKYAAYLQTGAGRLRADLAWVNLQAFLPPATSGRQRRALDLGGGTGVIALRLANAGFDVTLVDKSEAMLDLARRAADAAGCRAHVTFEPADIADLSSSCAASAFDVVACHNVLEYLENPRSALLYIRTALSRERHAAASILTRNRGGEVLKAAIKDGDAVSAANNLSAPAVRESLCGNHLRLFTPVELRNLLAEAGFEVVAEFGIRVVADYLPPDLLQTPSGYAAAFELERRLGALPEFAAIARYTQVLARPREAAANL